MLPAVNEHDSGADEISWSLVFPVGVRNRPAEAGCANCHEFLRERQRAPHRAIVSLSNGVGLWLRDHPSGDQCPTLDPEGWLRPKI